MPISPTCEVREGAGVWQSTVNGVNLTPGAAITIRQADPSGSGSWQLECVGTDETNVAASVNAALTIDGLARTASFVAPLAGAALIFESRVGVGSTVGRDADNATQPSYTTRFGLYTLVNALRVGALNESTEGSTSYGWAAKVNAVIRSALIAGEADLALTSGALALFDAVTGANDAADPTKITKATPSALELAGQVVGVSLGVYADGETAAYAGGGDVLDASSVIGTASEASFVVVDSSGHLVRQVAPLSTDKVVGWADAVGNLRVGSSGGGLISGTANAGVLTSAVTAYQAVCSAAAAGDATKIAKATPAALALAGAVIGIALQSGSIGAQISYAGVGDVVDIGLGVGEVGYAIVDSTAAIVRKKRLVGGEFAVGVVDSRGYIRVTPLRVSGVAVRNLRDMGASGIQGEDASPYLEAAVAELIAAGGGTLFVPNGIYSLRRPLLFEALNVQIIIAGEGLKTVIDGQISPLIAPFYNAWAGPVICYTSGYLMVTGTSPFSDGTQSLKLTAYSEVLETASTRWLQLTPYFVGLAPSRLSLLDRLTVEFWTKLDVMPSGGGKDVLNHWTWMGGSPHMSPATYFDNCLGLYATEDGKIHADLLTTSGQHSCATAAGMISAGVWKTVTLRYTGAALQILVNGVVQATTAASGTLVVPLETSWYIGRGMGPGWPTNTTEFNGIQGNIAGFQIHNIDRWPGVGVAVGDPVYTPSTTKPSQIGQTHLLCLLNFEVTRNSLVFGQAGGSGPSEVWLPISTNESHFNRGITLENLSVTSVYGPALYYAGALQSTLRHVALAGRYGLFMWNNCYNSHLDYVTAAGVQDMIAGISIQEACWLTHMKHIQTDAACPYGIIVASACSASIVDAYISCRKVGILHYGNGGPVGLDLGGNLSITDEGSGNIPGALADIVCALMISDSRLVCGGRVVFEVPNTSKPCVIIRGGQDHTFVGSTFTTNAGSTAPAWIQIVKMPEVLTVNDRFPQSIVLENCNEWNPTTIPRFALDAACTGIERVEIIEDAKRISFTYSRQAIASAVASRKMLNVNGSSTTSERRYGKRTTGNTAADVFTAVPLTDDASSKIVANVTAHGAGGRLFEQRLAGSWVMASGTATAATGGDTGDAAPNITAGVTASAALVVAAGTYKVQVTGEAATDWDWSVEVTVREIA
jgi:hypothetical protein